MAIPRSDGRCDNIGAQQRLLRKPLGPDSDPVRLWLHSERIAALLSIDELRRMFPEEFNDDVRIAIDNFARVKDTARDAADAARADFPHRVDAEELADWLLARETAKVRWSVAGAPLLVNPADSAATLGRASYEVLRHELLMTTEELLLFEGLPGDAGPALAAYRRAVDDAFATGDKAGPAGGQVFTDEIGSGQPVSGRSTASWWNRARIWRPRRRHPDRHRCNGRCASGRGGRGGKAQRRCPGPSWRQG